MQSEEKMAFKKEKNQIQYKADIHHVKAVKLDQTWAGREMGTIYISKHIQFKKFKQVSKTGMGVWENV